MPAKRCAIRKKFIKIVKQFLLDWIGLDWLAGTEFTFTQKDNLICLRVEYRFTLLRVLFSSRPEGRTKAGSTASYSFQVSSSSPSSSSYFFCRTHGVVVSAAHSCCSRPPTPAAVPARLGLLLMLSLLIPGWTAASTTEHWHYDKRWKE